MPRAPLPPWGKLGSCECHSGLLCASGSCWWEEVGRCWPELAPYQVSASLRGAVPSLAPRAGQRSAHREEAEGPGREPWVEASPGGQGGGFLTAPTPPRLQLFDGWFRGQTSLYGSDTVLPLSPQGGPGRPVCPGPQLGCGDKNLSL